MSRFRAIYGNKVDIAFGNADPDELLAVWAEELASFEPSDFKTALEACRFAYVEFPPTLLQFAALCRDSRRRRTQTQPRLESVHRDAAAEVMAEVHRLTKSTKDGTRDPKDWARRLLKREADGERLSLLQRRYAREALGLPLGDL